MGRFVGRTTMKSRRERVQFAWASRQRKLKKWIISGQYYVGVHTQERASTHRMSGKGPAQFQQVSSSLGHVYSLFILLFFFLVFFLFFFHFPFPLPLLPGTHHTLRPLIILFLPLFFLNHLYLCKSLFLSQQPSILLINSQSSFSLSLSTPHTQDSTSPSIGILQLSSIQLQDFLHPLSYSSTRTFLPYCCCLFPPFIHTQKECLFFVRIS